MLPVWVNNCVWFRRWYYYTLAKTADMINLLCELNAWKFMTLSDGRENRKGTMESVHPRWRSVLSHTIWGEGNAAVTIPSQRRGNPCAFPHSNTSSSSFSRAMFSNRFKNFYRVISKFVSHIHYLKIHIDEIGSRCDNFCMSTWLRYWTYFASQAAVRKPDMSPSIQFYSHVLEHSVPSAGYVPPTDLAKV